MYTTVFAVPTPTGRATSDLRPATSDQQPGPDILALRETTRRHHRQTMDQLSAGPWATPPSSPPPVVVVATRELSQPPWPSAIRSGAAWPDGRGPSYPTTPRQAEA